MVHKGPPDRIGGASKLDHNKGNAGYGAQNPKAASGRRNQKQSSPHQLQDAGNKPMVPAAASAAAAAAADLKKKMLKKARSIERISKVDLGHKQVEQLSTPSPRKSKRRKNPGLLKPSPAAKTPAATMSSAPAAPNYMKATTSSDARIGRQQTQPHQQVSKARSTSSTPAAAGKKNHPTATPKTPSKTPPPSVPGNTNKASKTLLLSRKPSLKLVIPVTKHHLAAPLFDDVNVSKATCSSTLKDSKFPDELELNPGGTQVEGTSVVRVCPYTYCSLNGHWHAPAVPLKRFLLAKRRAIKAQKSSRVRRSPSPRKRVVLVRGAAQEIATQNCSAQPTVMDLGGQNDDYFLDIYVASRGDNDDDEGRFRPTEEASATLHSHIQLQNVNPGHNGSYTEMNLQDDDNVDRLSDISLSQMGGTTACFLDHAIECPGQEGTPDDAHRHDASPMEACDEPKPDGGTLLMPCFGDFDFTRRKPIQEYQPSLTSSEVVEVDWEQEMPEYEDDAAGEDDEHDQRTAGTEDDAARQNGEKPSTTTQPPEWNGDQDVPDSSLSMNQVYFNLLFPGTAKSGSEEAENPTEEPTDESLEDDVNNREDGGNVSASVDALASYIAATCVDNLGNDWGSIGETTVESHDGVFLTETRADNQDIAETNQQAQQVAGEIHEIGFDILTADIQGENHDTVQGNQEPHESAEDTVSESHEMINIDGFLLIGMQIDKHGQTESSPETQENTEEVAITATVPQPDFTDQDEQTSTKVQQRGIKEPSSDEAETAKLKFVTTEVGGSEAIVEDTVVAEEEDNDMDNQVAEENGIATPPEKYLRETRLRCPKEAPATVPRDAAKRGQPLPDLDNELIRVDITRRDREEDMDEQMKGFNPRGPNFLPLEPDPEGEKVDLKHQMIDDRKNSEEWMIDHALQRAVNKLAPARKKKVALLVEAFETVAPPLPMYKAPLRTRSLGIAHAWPMQACS